MQTANCSGRGNKLFFLERGQSARPGQEICDRCSVRRECKEYADKSSSEWGIWGGEVRSREPVSRGQLIPVPTAADLVSRTTEPAREAGIKSPAPDPTIENDQEVKVIPQSLSATAVETFLACAARYKAEVIERARDVSSSAASLGTVCHEAIEAWMVNGHYKNGHADEWAVMQAYYDQSYWAAFTTADRYPEGVKLLKAWLKRQDWSERTVISVEQKSQFQLPTSKGYIPFNFIMDRLDQRSNGDYEVIDIKTLSIPLQPEELKQKVQARTYALAVQLAHPEIDRVWVTFDMLRYDSVGILFTKEDNRATWLHLRSIAERIIASDGSAETINPTCRWCIRKTICKTLHNHTTHGGTLGVVDAAWAAQQLSDTRDVIGALKAEEADLEKIVVDAMRQAEQESFITKDLEVSVGVSGRRHIDPQMLAQLIGPEIMTKYASINVGNVDLILKEENIDPVVKSQIRQLFTINYSEPSIKIKKRNPF